MRQLLLLALVFGITTTVPSVFAGKKDGEPKKEAAEGETKKKKEGGAEDAAKPKPEAMVITGNLTAGEEKDGKASYILTVDTRVITIHENPKVTGLKEMVGKKVTISCKGTIAKSKKGESLHIAKLESITEVPAAQ